MSPESIARRVLRRIWLWLRWILFFPVSLIAGWLVYSLADKTAGGFLAVPVATAASLFVAQTLGPSPFACASVVAIATLVLTVLGWVFGGNVFWLLGWIAGTAAVTFRNFRRLEITKKDIRVLRWFLFFPAACVTGIAAVLAVVALMERWAKSTGSSTGTDAPAYAVMSSAAVFLGSAVYVLVGGLIAPAHRPIVVFLMAPLSYLLAFAAAGDLSWGRAAYLGLSWLAGTALGALPGLSRTPAAQEPWGRLAGATEGKGRRYKGTAPYQDLALDRKTFFGRDRETRHFLNLVLAERLVVLFAKSGMGKSSLINASILEPLRQQGYFPFVARLNDPGLAPSRALIDTVRRIARDEAVDLTGGDESSLFQFFKTAEFWSERDDLLRPVLVLDQFEELFTLHNAWVRKEFTGQLAELVRGRVSANRQEEGETAPKSAVDDAAPDLKIVIALREDFLANLEDLSAEIPAILHNRFRLGPLSAKAAREAIVEPARLADDTFDTSRFSYQEAAVERMIAFLAKRRMGTESAEDDEVEPVQLQLICHYLEETVRARQSAQKEEAEIQISEAYLGGEEQMQQVLEGFYDRTIASVRPWSKARAVRRLCEHRLISGGGRRLTEDEEEIQRRYDISGALLRQLVDARLLRAEPRLGGTFYEVSHDRLVEPILKSRRKRATRLRWIAVSAVPLFLAISLSLGSRIFDRRHQEAEIRAHLLEQDPKSAIQSAVQLVRRHGFSHTNLLEMAEPVLNPSTFAVFARTSTDAWEWDNPAQAKQVVDHIRRAYPTYLGACPDGPDGTGCARMLLGAVISTLDHARTRAENAASVVMSVDQLRAEVLDGYWKRYPRPGPGGCGSESLVLVPTKDGAFRIHQRVVNTDLYKACLEAPIEKESKKESGASYYSSVSWYEAVAYAALRGGRLPSKAELGNARGKIDSSGDAEWSQDEEQSQITPPGFQSPSMAARPFRVVW